MIYFYDIDKKYIGCRELKFGETVPNNVTTIAPVLTDGEQAHFIDGAWVVSIAPADPVVDPALYIPTADERLDVLEPEVVDIKQTIEVIFG